MAKTYLAIMKEEALKEAAGSSAAWSEEGDSGEEHDRQRRQSAPSPSRIFMAWIKRSNNSLVERASTLQHESVIEDSIISPDQEWTGERVRRTSRRRSVRAVGVTVLTTTTEKVDGELEGLKEENEHLKEIVSEQRGAVLSLLIIASLATVALGLELCLTTEVPRCIIDRTKTYRVL